MKIIKIIFFGLFLISCDFLNIGPKKYKRSIKYVNNTNHTIKVITYKESQFIFSLNKNESVIPFHYDKFEVHKPVVSYYQLGFISFYADFSYVDSVVVIYDDSIKTTHNSRLNYNKNTALSFENNRNITNGNNYKITKLCDSKHDLVEDYSFTFYEQDFENAKLSKY